MNREIKFRAWDKQCKLMCKVLRIDFDQQGNIDGIELHSGNQEGTSHYIHDGTAVSLKDIFLMRYTGLKDCKGTEIYEGDILKHTYYTFRPNDPPEIEIFEVKYMLLHNCGDCTQDSGIGFNFYLKESDLEDIEIIGNIYEHPSLLEKKDV